MPLLIWLGYNQCWHHMGQCHLYNLVLSSNTLTLWGGITSNPIHSFNKSCISLVKVIVKISATTYYIGQYSNSTTLFMIFSLMKWYCTSIYSHMSWFVRVLARTIESSLSYMMVVASSCTQHVSSISCLSQMTSLVHWLITMYFASIVECVTICYHLLFHDTTSSPTKTTYLEVDLRFFTSLAQFALE